VSVCWSEVEYHEEGEEGSYRIRLIFQETHGIFNHDFILYPDEFHNLFGDPWSDDIEVDFAHVDLSIL
jgi:hypothetical protein